MTQPPYRPPDDRSMRRLALFVTALIVIVAIGSVPPKHGGGAQKKSICVCIPARAGLILKSAIARTQSTVHGAIYQ
jgi:hypothetical protein